MATQSLYRRFRPRKFSELYGQEHVVRALRNAVINGREGQAYLFSGPRGTGKTTTARILAKVLNCAAPADGEPCCECDSCRAVEAGNSYDVLELDAASNNGVEEVRELIASAALTSPGRHRVFILDEAHMLSRPAEAALLKTLEEPPEHVVFVLATTDPQKISETIRSRVQHLQFHLLPVEELEKYVRHVVASAGLEVGDDDIDLVLRQGGGSARDTLSALELVVSGGSEPEAVRATDELIDALVARDQARVLAAVASAVNLGRDPRGLAEDIVRSMRDSFLAVLSPDLVQLPADTVRDLAARARSLGNRTVVRIMEVLGTTLVEMRHAPDPRLLLEVALVRIAMPDIDDSADVLAARVAALEERVSNIVSSGGVPLAPAPVNESTGRARIGGRAAPTGGTARPAPDAPAASRTPEPASP
ncbi:MAG: DNA polymerase III subunit gamma/tau, partial [Acidimicrobiales bacterium]